MFMIGFVFWRHCHLDSLTIIIAILATWRLSAMLSYETGPLNAFTWVRELTGIAHDDFGEKVAVPNSFFAELLDCVWCISVWLGFVVTVVLYFYPVLVWVLLPFALSAGAILIERLIYV